MTRLNRPSLLLRACSWAVEAASAFLVIASLTAVAAADVRVQGNAAAVRIEANQAKVSEVLAALVADFDIRYRSSIVLDDMRSGTYSGSLRQVLSRLLDGYNFVIEGGDAKLQIIVLSKASDNAHPAVVPASGGAAKNPATDWRPRR